MRSRDPRYFETFEFHDSKQYLRYYALKLRIEKIKIFKTRTLSTFENSIFLESLEIKFESNQCNEG